MDKLAIIGSGYMAKIISARANELGYIVHCFGLDDGDEFGDVINYHKMSIFDIDAITDICRKASVRGVLCTTELTIFPAAQIANNLGLSFNSVELSRNITDKYYIREKAKSLKFLHSPKSWICRFGEQPQINKYPIIVKPDAAGGKLGLSIVYNKNDMSVAVLKAAQNSKNGLAICEEFLDGGKEYSVESLSYKGKHYILQITEKDSSGPPHCVELGHHQPARLECQMVERVKAAITELLTAVGVEYGPCHTEIKIIEDELFLIELNARPGGDCIAYPLTELSTGYPYITGMIDVAIGALDVARIPDKSIAYAGIYFVTQSTAWLKPIFDTCESYEWLYEKNYVSDILSEITHNDCKHTNYMIYYSRNGRPELRNK